MSFLIPITSEGVLSSLAFCAVTFQNISGTPTEKFPSETPSCIVAEYLKNTLNP